MNSPLKKDVKLIAQQLGKPEGEYALDVGKRMNQGNFYINKNSMTSMDIAPNDHILEMGMGNGFFVEELIAKQEGVRYTGFDYSQEMVDDAASRNMILVNKQRAQFICGDAHSMPFDDGVFDKALTVNTVYFLDEIEIVVKEFHRVLKPYGSLIIGFRPKEIMNTYPIAPYINMFSVEEMGELLKANGFTLTQSFQMEETSADYVDPDVRDVFAVMCASANTI